jgi:hypothetical protein
MVNEPRGTTVLVFISNDLADFPTNVRNGSKADIALGRSCCKNQRVNAYHFIVLGIVAAAIAIPAYRFPKRGFLFQFGVGLVIAAGLAGLLMLILYLYFIALGEA